MGSLVYLEPAYIKSHRNCPHATPVWQKPREGAAISWTQEKNPHQGPSAVRGKIVTAQ